jgi:hypothetical protein
VPGLHFKIKFFLLLNLPLIIFFGGGIFIFGLHKMSFYFFCYTFFFLNVLLISNAFLESLLSRIALFEKKINDQIDMLNLTSDLLAEEIRKIKAPLASVPETRSVESAYGISKNLLMTNLKSIEDRSYDLRSQLDTVKELGSICSEINKGLEEITRSADQSWSHQGGKLVQLLTLSETIKDQAETLRKEMSPIFLALPSSAPVKAERRPVLKKLISFAGKKSA